MEPLEDRLAPIVARAIARVRGCVVIGIAGAQGTGKSTVSARLHERLAREHGLRVVALALDDFYLPRAARLALADRSHPLLATRGVPGTHELQPLREALLQLRAAGAGQPIALPCFSKALDDRLPEPRLVEGPFDAVLFEGWCVGAQPQLEAELQAPINPLERDEDPDGRFRHFVNDQLTQPYASLWRELDCLIYLAAPDMETVHAYRAEQERSLRAAGPGVMSSTQLRRFVQHFERITLHMLRDTPSHADVVVELDAQRRVLSLLER